ncbi:MULTISPECIES: hypothetical protein [Acinetobacter calcoaceticus/baumannii complex]|uniref:hypothetical protein n=1 Tax=Acinetobacter calcoaceticus/baumannii complex TaxID=909768 RepID=UPI00234051A5|nr:hypothetical protein [Acinetobacter baumannii]MDC4075707.1 hypothetical protein [Acinetobacter baumannii]MDC4101519.1 hypothetical protein [Acinetobacter baumannii]
MYQLTVKETRGSKTWTHELGSHIPEVPRSCTVIRMNLMVSTMFLPPAPLKNFLINILNTSSAWEFDFEIKEVPQETPHQTVAIFKGMDVVPETNRLLVLHMVTGDVVSPVKRKACNHYHTPAGIVKEYMIKEWAYQDELNKALGLTALDPEKLEELEKRAEADDVDPRFNPQKIVDALADVLSEIFPEAKVHVRKS